MKPLWIGPLTILSANYNCNNDSLDLSSDPSLKLIYNTFHISKVNPFVNNNYTLFLPRQLDKPGPVSQDIYKVDKVIEYRKALRTGVLQYKVCCSEYSLEDDQWLDAKDISTRIL